MNKVKTKKSEFVKLVEQMVEKSNDPMSIDEILIKFAPNFPFSVKKVVDVGYPDRKIAFAVGQIILIEDTAIISGSNWYFASNFKWRIPGDLKQWVLV